MLSVGKYHNLRPTMFRDNNYMLRVKVAGRTFISATIWNEAEPNFNFDSIKALDRELSGLLVEVWNKGTNGSLIGVGKLDLQQEVLVGHANKNQASLYPMVVCEEELPVGSLQGNIVGYLSTVVLVGSAEQINRYIRSHRSKLSKAAKEPIVVESIKPSELKQE